MIDLNNGSARELIRKEEMGQLQRTGTLIVDDRRRRPLYFDGRFLAARDLIRDQNYFLARQADLGRALGTGVVHGLTVTLVPDAFAVQIAPGHGVTASGELVVLPESITVHLANAAATQRLHQTFELLPIPHSPFHSRAGLFILALRPVEFTAHPIASYPTTINGSRSVEDGDVVEGVAITLIPYRDDGATVEMDRRRARAAREIFVAGAASGLPAGVLPLAMLALDRNVVRWIDPFLVRREVGAEHGDILGLGFSPRALREAQLFQYRQQLLEIMAQRGTGDGEQRFAATDYFYALPPAGPMPVVAINTADFSQTYFPPEIEVELSLIPQDEIPALLEESLRLPPVDLTLNGEELESTAVLVLIPVPRHRVRSLKSQLNNLSRSLLPAAPDLVARRKPIEILTGLRVARLFQPIIRPQAPADAAWIAELNRAAQENNGMIWYVRRRNLNYKSAVVGVPVPIEGDETTVEREVANRLSAIGESGLVPNLGALRAGTTARANAEMVSILSSPVFARSQLLLAGALRELASVPPPAAEEGATTVTRNDVLRVGERFTDPQSGEGLAHLETIAPAIRDNSEVLTQIVASGRVPELDRAARLLPEAERATFAANLLEAASGNDAEAVRRLIDNTLRDTTLRRLGR
jgi:hypothetical protein